MSFAASVFLLAVAVWPLLALLSYETLHPALQALFPPGVLVGPADYFRGWVPVKRHDRGYLLGGELRRGYETIGRATPILDLLVEFRRRLREGSSRQRPRVSLNRGLDPIRLQTNTTSDSP